MQTVQQVSVVVRSKPSTQKASNEVKRKAKIAWPAAKEKSSYRRFEEVVCKKIYKMKGTVQERLKRLAETIYETGKLEFGEQPVKKKVTVQCSKYFSL